MGQANQLASCLDNNERRGIEDSCLAASLQLSCYSWQGIKQCPLLTNHYMPSDNNCSLQRIWRHYSTKIVCYQRATRGKRRTSLEDVNEMPRLARLASCPFCILEILKVRLLKFQPSIQIRPHGSDS
jgi:hypothetical protein